MNPIPSRYVPTRPARAAYLSDEDVQTQSIADWLEAAGFGGAASLLRSAARPTEIVTQAEAVNAFIDPLAKVRIYSVEHGAYWRPEASGYTQCRVTAGVFTFEGAVKRTMHCDASKGIEFEVLP